MADALPDDPSTLKAMLIAEWIRSERLVQIIKDLQRHRFGRRAEKVGAILPGAVAIADHAQPGFVNEGGGLEGVGGAFLRHARHGELAQFVVNERQKLFRSLAITMADGLQDLGQLVHG